MATQTLTSHDEDYIQTGIGNRKVNKGPKCGDFTEIPIIDLSNATSPHFEERKAVAKEIFDACTNVGFFYVKNHGVDQAVIEGVKNEAKRFFHELAVEDKMELDMSKNAEFYGYAPIRTTLPDGAVRARLFESINFGYEPSMDPGAVDTQDNGPSFWPQEEKLPGFKDNVGKYYAAVMQLSRDLLRLFAIGLDLDEHFFDQFVKHPGVLLKLNHYPAAVPDSSLNSGIHAHSDLESFTILLQDDVKSLEVLSKNGDWIPADPIPGTFVVNIGDALSMWTNDLFLSTIHRAYNKEGKVRYSVPFFFGADYDAVMRTLPSCINEARPLKYEPITAGEYVRNRLSMTYPKKATATQTPAVKV